MKSTQTDEQLIEQFLTGEHAEAERAFERLVTRHGPMVLGVCRQVLKHEQNAEDVFQATFLTLARRAATIRDPRVLGGWLHEVAYRKALRLRTQVTRHRMLPGLSQNEVSNGEAESHAVRKEHRLILHAELDRLPREYRTLVVHCYLKGKSNEEVSRLLGLPVGTVKGRLWRARKMLRQRLRRRIDLEANQFAQAWG
jgi:RNA polymerase sigma factor (sigma-70 family)